MTEPCEMNHIYRARASRSLATLLFTNVLLYVSSCTNDDKQIKPNVPIVTSPKPTPSVNPTMPCDSGFDYGYTNKISYFVGEKVTAFIQGHQNIDLCKLDIFDIHGNISFSIPTSLTVQSISSPNPSTDGFGFLPTVQFELPTNIESGIYFIEKEIPFLVKSKPPVDLTIVYASNTANAYCTSGGKSLYNFNSSNNEGAKMVSFQRPIEMERFSKHCFKWFTKLNNFTVGYIADIDLEHYESIKNSKILIVVGHSEYWSKKARLNFDSFVEAGGHALILSGNTMWWQVRYANDNKQLVCYRSEAVDPETDPFLKTTTWDNPSLNYSIISSIGVDFTRGGYGSNHGWDGYKINAPDSPLLEGLNLKKGDLLSLKTDEYDGAPLTPFDSTGYPTIDNTILHAHRVELVGFDRILDKRERAGTFIVLQRTPTSGIIVNTASTDWCSENGMGGNSGDKIKMITKNAITKLIQKQPIFTN